MKQIAIRSRFYNQSDRFCEHLPALERDAPEAAARFRRWRGASGRHYLVSVYPLHRCPDYTDAVLMAVEGRNGRCIWIGEADALSPSSLDSAYLCGANEVHIYLLANTAAERKAVIHDLAPTRPCAM